MPIKTINFRSWEQVRGHLSAHIPTLFTSSQTSTVIPYEFLDQSLTDRDIILGNLAQLPKKLRLQDDLLVVSGGVTWQDALEFVHRHGRDLLSYPTEKLACVTAGVATSATGERSFSGGALRNQIEKIIYLDFNGNENVLAQNALVLENPTVLSAYQKAYRFYKGFKNAPFPRMERAVDLMIGTEGQLGVVRDVFLRTQKTAAVKYFFLKIPSWRVDYRLHLEIFAKVQDFRGSIKCVEFADGESLNAQEDGIFIEVLQDEFEKLYENLFAKLSLGEESIFELGRIPYQEMRAGIPRYVSHFNSLHKTKKLGTDAQVVVKHFQKLLDLYRVLGKQGIKNILFGHFGDAHLHFNFLAKPEQTQQCQDLLEIFYKEIQGIGGSPFAEHGIGLLKQDFLKPFLSNIQIDMFIELKKRHDPYNQFFPMGYLNIRDLKK